MMGVESVVLRAAGSQLRPAPDSYDGFVASFGPRLVSYWKFQNGGADANGIQHATIIGSPELNVETIVDLDTIAEGAPADGECIAWRGTSGVYAEAAHNAQHKTAQGTIVVTFQHDALSVKSTLVAADRAVGGTSAGAGGFAMEVTTDGAPRCFLRRQSGGTVVQLLGQAGDVQLNHAYTMIFKWGPGGLSMALWDASEGLVRRVTDPLEDGVTGSSPIRFGAWHTDISHHDGPYGRVVWLNRRISDAEEAILPRPRTIVRETAPPVGEFPFVTISNPPVSHAGVANRPGYSPSDPRSASIIDPMSGIEIMRVGGDAGSSVLINGNQSTGLVFPQRLRNENSPRMQKVWNADGTLLVIDRLFAQGGDAGNSVRSYLIDADGSHGAGAPWRIARASNSTGLGDSNVGIWWVWDPDAPLRAYSVTDAGAVYEWWPIGGNGHSTGEVNQVRGAISGFGSFNQGRRHQVHTNWSNSAANLYMTLTCRRNSDGRWGGMRINLRTGDTGPFVPTPHFAGFTQDSDRGAQGTSSTGLYTLFSPNGNRQTIVRMDQTDGGNPIVVADTDNVDGQGISHCDFGEVNGIEYLIGMRSTTSGFRGFRIDDETYKVWGTFPGANPQHTSVRSYRDRFETYGAAGGGTSGLRYAVWTRSAGSGGHPRAILGVRLGPDDQDELRFICNHRGVRTNNANECHAQPSPDGRHVAFPSNWHEPGVVSDGHVHPYVAMMPDAWWSSNNAGA